jgi:hypothetical protein
MMREIQIVGSGLVFVFIIGLVLNEVFTAVNFNESSSPFGSVYTTLETTGQSALTLLVVGFIVVAAGGIMKFFGGFR